MAVCNRKYSDPDMGGSDEYYLKMMNKILCGCRIPGTSTGETPGQLLDWLYIGNYRDAENHAGLRELGITHVLNCAAFRQSPHNPYRPDVGIVGYLQFNAQDSEDYNMLQHFPKARAFIDNARAINGKVLVHCAAGINRCGVICAAYIMLDKKWDLLSTVAFMKSRRRMLLANRGFRRQLVMLARKHRLLKKADVLATPDVVHYLQA